MRILYLLIFVLFSQVNIAQRVTMYTASGSAGIQNMCFDQEGNRYITGYYSGRAYFADKLPDVMSASYYMAKMSPDNQMIWVKPIEDKKTRWHMLVRNNQLYVLAGFYSNDFDADVYKRSMHLEKYSLDGTLISSVELATTDNHDMWIAAYIDEWGITVEATVKGDENAFKLRGTSFTKKLYSAVVFYKFDFEGQQKWQYKMEGGFNGFTDLRVGDVTSDALGNTYIASYYSYSAELGIASYATKIAFEGPIDLYESGCFLLKLDNTGKPVLSKVIADYSFDLEKLLATDDGQVYLSAYYKGSAAYEKANPSEGNYKAAIFMGAPLPDTKSGEGITEPSEDHVYALLDKDFNLVWKQFSQSYETTRARSMHLIGDTLHVCGSSGDVLTIGGKTLNLVSDRYGDTFYSATNAKTGEVLSVKGFTAGKSNLGEIYADNSGNLVIVSGFFEPVTIDGVVYEPKGSINTSFIYDFNPNLGSGTASTGTGNTTTTTTNAVGNYAVGDHVRCDWKGYGKYYAAVITQIDGQKYLVKYASDGSEEWTTAQYLKIPEKGVYKIGDAIEGNWKGGGTWYPGKIGKIEGERFYIEYNDGDVEWTTGEFIRRL